MCGHNSFTGETEHHVWLYWKRTVESFGWFPLNLTINTPFLLALFALYPFTVINHSYKHDYMLSCTNPPSKPSDLGVVSGTPDTVFFMNPPWHDLLDVLPFPVPFCLLQISSRLFLEYFLINHFDSTPHLRVYFWGTQPKTVSDYFKPIIFFTQWDFIASQDL